MIKSIYEKFMRTNQQLAAAGNPVAAENAIRSLQHMLENETITKEARLALLAKLNEELRMRQIVEAATAVSKNPEMTISASSS